MVDHFIFYIKCLQMPEIEIIKAFSKSKLGLRQTNRQCVLIVFTVCHYLPAKIYIGQTDRSHALGLQVDGEGDRLVYVRLICPTVTGQISTALLSGSVLLKRFTGGK